MVITKQNILCLFTYHLSALSLSCSCGQHSTKVVRELGLGFYRFFSFPVMMALNRDLLQFILSGFFKSNKNYNNIFKNLESRVQLPIV